MGYISIYLAFISKANLILSPAMAMFMLKFMLPLLFLAMIPPKTGILNILISECLKPLFFTRFHNVMSCLEFGTQEI